ncbi:D-glycero-beta-D-manno-heptose 1,7-bisphosphate 7-phosphatase [Litorilinea aerophila]|uniref:D,D-heptose 1,7-bisphosphate phosphatase n=1 Tax=Litorilinea aerophila TaxID=1204385 RepID=A0A540VFJ8_9CHLR|nr:D-glycero-beta-D-manno-heptose 1,7-bisphosphate 7-phosphatase [Litorilinea aerophila]MCC9076806.1 D-glycero-beta-D-manno-heptose 1,7-bisphosphate 7-phosphatase [Litorilinea aerophila]OUC06858.1 hypothetical protein RY27_18410 [Litorilinea aerophila]
MIAGVFLDRDGVLNRERPDYVKGWDEFQWLPGVMPALARLAKLGCPIAVLTNQSAIARGLVSTATVAAIHRRMQAEVAAAGGRIDAFFVCPHHPDDGCDCRKPKPGLLRQAAAHFQLDLAQCVFIGDSITDAQAAYAVYCASVLVQSGRQGPNLPSLLPPALQDVPIVPDLAAAVAWLFDKESVAIE